MIMSFLFQNSICCHILESLCDSPLLGWRWCYSPKLDIIINRFGGKKGLKLYWIWGICEIFQGERTRLMVSNEYYIKNKHLRKEYYLKIYIWESSEFRPVEFIKEGFLKYKCIFPPKFWSLLCGRLWSLPISLLFFLDNKP